MGIKRQRRTVKKPLVALDAGVSGRAEGRKSFDGSFYESEFTFDLQSRLQNLLCTKGIDVVLTMPDRGCPLTQAERCTAASAAGADILVSLRAGSFGRSWNSEEGWGASVFQFGSRAEELAQAIRRASVPALGIPDRGIFESRQTLLRDAGMPAVRIEHGFFTNKKELDLLKSEAFRDACARADMEGILDYFHDKYGRWDWRKSEYRRMQQMHVVRIPQERFRICWWDRGRYSENLTNYLGGGHFIDTWDDGIRHTFPCANLCADFNASAANVYAIKNLAEQGCIAGKKVICHCGTFAEEFRGKAPHTLLISDMGKLSMEPVPAVPAGTAYAISGAPVIMGGCRVPYQAVRDEGWSESISYPGMHGFLGISGKTVVYAAFSTQSPNLYESGEAFWKLAPLGLTEVIEIGGRGFAIKSRGRLKTVKGENKIANTVITF